MYEKGWIKKGKLRRLRKGYIHSMRVDNNTGMVISEITTWSILVVSGAVLHTSGITDIQTAGDAARALEPLVNSFPHAGFMAKVIFATGIIGLGFLAVPILSGSAAYAAAEALNWEEGLNLKLKKAHGFYGIITIATIIGLIINFIGISPVKALVYSAVLNGVAAVPLIFLVTRISLNRKIMGKYKGGTLSRIFLWLTFIGMAAAAIGMFLTLGK